MPKDYTDYPVDYGIDDKVTDRFGTVATVSGYYIGRSGLRYELEVQDKSWFEYPKYLKKVQTIGIKAD